LRQCRAGGLAIQQQPGHSWWLMLVVSKSKHFKFFVRLVSMAWRFRPVQWVSRRVPSKSRRGTVAKRIYAVFD
jgi:hypothetical protein